MARASASSAGSGAARPSVTRHRFRAFLGNVLMDSGIPQAPVADHPPRPRQLHRRRRALALRVANGRVPLGLRRAGERSQRSFDVGATASRNRDLDRRSPALLLSTWTTGATPSGTAPIEHQQGEFWRCLGRATTSSGAGPVPRRPTSAMPPRSAFHRGAGEQVRHRPQARDVR